MSNFPIDRQELRVELLLKDERFVFASLADIEECQAFRPVVPARPSLAETREGKRAREKLVAAQSEFDEALKALGTVSYFQPAAYQSPTNTAWQIYKRIGMETGSSWPDESRTGKEYSRARFLIYVSRKWKHLFSQVCVPYMVCTMSTFTVASVDPAEHVGERMQVISALLLTGVRFLCAARPNSR